MNRNWLILIIVSIITLSGCASTSEKQFKQAQKSIQQGNYTAAFQQAARSLQADIGHYKTIAAFPNIANNAYQQHMNNIEQFKSTSNWDQVAYGYDKIIQMNQSIQLLQQNLRIFMNNTRTSNQNRANMQALLTLTPRPVQKQRNIFYNKAAEAHYVRGITQGQMGTYRSAAQSFKQAVSFIPSYKDAATQAEKFTHLADLADAKISYDQGIQFVQNKQHRAAAKAFSKAASFIPNYQDAPQLAVRYKNIADQEDALKHYNAAQRLATAQQYRDAAAEFKVSLAFVANYRNALSLSMKYKDLADQQDARRQYELAQQYMEQQNFQAASQAFQASENFVMNFRDARFMAQKAASYVPPVNYQLKRLVIDSFKDGIPHTYVQHIQNPNSIHDIKILHVSVRNRGRFDRYGEFWPYRLHIEGTFEFYQWDNGQKTEHTHKLDRDFYFHLIKTNRNSWRAAIR